MTRELAERYLRAKAIAMAAADLSGEQREIYVTGESGGDDGLLREVRWMLAALEDSQPTSLPRLAIAAPDLSGHDATASGPRHYRVLRKLGEGGMGVVYLAERGDGGFVQQVALKVLNAAAESSPFLLERFARERQLLARLDHPGIARLLDGGVLEGDQPFLAMEYVEGERIDSWCERRQLDLRARVGLFLEVCAAVEFAHRNLIIHRDLKPANILVNARGEPKLLDFGIARLVDGQPDVGMTQTGQHALTLAYASPEQIEHQPLTTAADVYSLGVVLYQLVAGQRPYQHLSSPHQLSTAIIGGDVVPPSRTARKAAGGGAPRKVPADIDAIVLKAMRRVAAERYATVAELSADLRNWLQQRPVQARRGRYLYRLRRYVQRHRWVLALAAAVVLAVLGGLAASLLALRQTRAEQRVAQQRQHELERMVAFQQSMLESVDIDAMGRMLGERPQAGGTAKAPAANSTDLARNALEVYVVAHALDSLDRQFGDAPLLQADLRQSLARVLITIGRYGHAADELRQVLTVRRQHLAAGDAALISARGDLGLALLEQGQLDEAAGVLQEARQLDELPPAHPARVAVETTYARVLAARGHLQDALALQKALSQKLRQALPPADPASMRVRRDMVETLIALGRRDEARAVLEPLVTLYRDTLGAEHPDTLDATMTLATLLHSQDNEYERALALARDVAAIRRRRLGADHPATLEAESMVAADMVRLAQDAPARADAHAQMAHVIEARSRVLGADHPQTLEAEEDMVRLLVKEGRADQATELQRRILASRERLLGADHPDTLFTRGGLAALLRKAGHYDEALAVAKRVLAEQRRVLGADHPIVSATLHLIGQIETGARRWAQARTAYEEALTDRRRRLGVFNGHTIETAISLYPVLFKLGDAAAARKVRAEYLDPLIALNPDTLNAGLRAERESAIDAERFADSALAH